MKKATTYDAAEFPETDEDVVACLDAALDDGDPALAFAAFDDIARAQGAVQLAKDATASPIETVDDFLCKSVLMGSLLSEVKQLDYNVATGAAMAEARDIMAGKTPAKVYATADDLLAALADERD